MHKLIGEVSLLIMVVHFQAFSQQNVGIGTNTPNSKLHVRGALTGTQITLEETSTAAFLRMSAEPNVTGPYIGTTSNHRFTLVANNQPVVYLTTAGNVGIGLNNPQKRLGIRGGIVVDQNDQNAGSTEFGLQFGDNSGEVIGSKRNVGTNQYGLDFYTANTLRMTLSHNGNLGIGTNNPQGLLEIKTGNDRSIMFRHDLVPALEIGSSNPNDALAGIMRFRNALEIMPSSDGTRAGKVDVRNKTGNPTIILDGENGFINAANFPSYNQKVTGYYPLNFIPIGIVNSTMTDITVEFPGPGFAFIEAGVNGYFQEMAGITNASMEVKLDEYTPADNYIFTLEKINMYSGAYACPTIYYETQIPSKVSRRYKLILYKNGPGPGNHIVGPGFIKVWYYPSKLPAS